MMQVRRNWRLYALFAPVLLYFIVFHYVPMYGVQIAFKDFIANKGIMDSPWVGFKHFERFLTAFIFGALSKYDGHRVI